MFIKKTSTIIFLSIILIIFSSAIVVSRMDKTNIHRFLTSKFSNENSSNKIVLAFTTDYSGDKSSYNQIIKNSNSINDIATSTYTINNLGHLSGKAPKDQISIANNNGIDSLAMITNNFNGNIAKAVLENANIRQTLIKNISSTLKSNNYNGVNIDFEGVYPYDRNYYTTFISELYAVLHPQGLIVTASVPAKVIDNPENSWNGAYDYSEIGKYTDKVIIMTYDEHSPGGSAGPIASIDWVKNVVNYTKSTIPSYKIILGIAAYGYDWSSKGTKAYGINSIYTLAKTYNAQINWDNASQSPHFDYKDKSGNSHKVWFENSTSLSYKLDIINNNNLGGLALWRLGLENQDYWSIIKSKLNK